MFKQASSFNQDLSAWGPSLTAVTDMSYTIDRGSYVLLPANGCTLGDQAAKLASSCTKLGKSDVTTRIQKYVSGCIFIQPGSECLGSLLDGSH